MLTNPGPIQEIQAPPGVDSRLWLVDLDEYSRAHVLSGLTQREHRRAARMAAARDGRRFLARRHALRKLLADDLGCAPESVEIISEPLGRPRLATSSLSFNLAHSGAMALIGVHGSGQIGVDLERIRPVPEMRAIVRNHFTSSEADEWRSAGSEERHAAFLGTWTRKEAVAKAVGLGVAAMFDRIETAPSGEAMSTTVRGEMADYRVTVYSLDLPIRFAAAMALTGPHSNPIGRMLT